MHTSSVPRITRLQDAPSHEDRVLLEGPHSRTKDLWLVLRAVRDFIAGFRTLHFVGPCVTVFGSARFPESHPYYTLGWRRRGRGAHPPIRHRAVRVAARGGHPLLVAW